MARLWLTLYVPLIGQLLQYFKSLLLPQLRAARLVILIEQFPKSQFLTNTELGTTTSSAAPTTSPRISSSIPSATSITTPTPSQSPTPGHSSSKAWIAGAVIGPIAAIALAFLGYWLGHRRAKATAEQAPTYTDSKPPGEWPPRHELGSDGRQSIPPGMHEA
jgi:hypothetical protein